MYRRDEVITALFGRVGFRESTQSGYTDKVDTANRASKSKRHFEDFHALVSVPTLFDVCNKDAAITTDNFNLYLKELQEAAILAVIDGVMSEPEVIEQLMEFSRDDQQVIPMPNIGRFVGRQIRIAPVLNRSIAINSITAFFDGVADFNLYVFDNVIKAPIFTIPVTTVADSQVVVIPTQDIILSYMSNRSKSGLYWLGYFQDDLGDVQAYDEQPYNYYSGKCYGSQSIECIPIAGQTDFTRFNPYITSRTAGLNVEYTTLQDFTELIIKNAPIFDTAIGLQMASMIVERVMYGTRSNEAQRINEQATASLYSELNQARATEEQPFSPGFRSKLQKEFKRLNETLLPPQKAVSSRIKDNRCYTQRFPR